jgi:hypothetical protein
MSRIPHCLDNPLTGGGQVVNYAQAGRLLPTGRKFLVLIPVRD